MDSEEKTDLTNSLGDEDLDDDDDESEEDDEDVYDVPVTLTRKTHPLPPSVQKPALLHLPKSVSVKREDDEEDDDDVSPSFISDSIKRTVSSAGCETAVPAPADKVRMGIDLKQHLSQSVVFEEKKPSALDESRKLFQRLWTDEDEIELLQGFLEYTRQRAMGQHNHHDTSLFYDQIRGKLQLDFNKNQLVEKLRRLKKKYRNVLNRINSGKDYAFKSAHDQSTFEISCKIWRSAAGHLPGLPTPVAAAATAEENNNAYDLEDDPNPCFVSNNNDYHCNDDGNHNSAERKGSSSIPRSRKRPRGRSPERPNNNSNNNALNVSALGSSSSLPGLVEDTVRSCLSPLFKELLQTAMNGPGGIRYFGGMGSLSPVPLNLGGATISCGDTANEKWRKQQILELEVYSKRLELVQEQIKSMLQELRSSGRS